MVNLPYANGIARCVYSGTYGGGKWANVFHVGFATYPGSAADMASLATALRTAWDSNIKALCVASVQLTTTTVTDLTSAYGQGGIDTTTSTGTYAGTALPSSTACAVSFKIGRRYRGGHPRMYLPAGSVSSITNNTNWLGAFITLVTNAMAAWRTAVNALTYASTGNVRLVCLSYYSGKVLRAVPQPDDVYDLGVHQRIDTQRRRLGREAI